MEKVKDCAICLDEGFLLIRKGNYETKYHCICQRGSAHAYEGRNCGKNKTQYYCRGAGFLGDTVLREISRDNRKRLEMELRKDGRFYYQSEDRPIPKEYRATMGLAAPNHSPVLLGDGAVIGGC